LAGSRTNHHECEESWRTASPLKIAQDLLKSAEKHTVIAKLTVAKNISALAMAGIPMQPIANSPPHIMSSSQVPTAFNAVSHLPPQGYEPPYYPVYKQRLLSTVLTCPSEKQINDQPWKFLGYRALAKWAGSSPDALIIRRFNTAHARVLLFMQDEIAQIEADLEELDKKNMWSPDLVHNGTFREEHEQERTNLLGLLATKLKAYG